MTIIDLTKEVQIELGVPADGQIGPITMRAIHKRICGEPEKAIADILCRPLDSRSEASIASLNPIVQPLARNLVALAGEHGVEIKVISGNRTFAEQDELYSQGRTKSGNVVTNAKGGWSNHNFGLAFDIGVWEESGYQPESKSYKIVGNLGKAIGLEWGGDWAKLIDEPHFEYVPSWAKQLNSSERLFEYRKRNSSGISII
jgi:peptidoglycan L-alanyl-D-glutamate endopeptidase CwlK